LKCKDPEECPLNFKERAFKAGRRFSDTVYNRLIGMRDELNVMITEAEQERQDQDPAIPSKIEVDTQNLARKSAKENPEDDEDIAIKSKEETELIDLDISEINKMVTGIQNSSKQSNRREW